MRIGVLVFMVAALLTGGCGGGGGGGGDDTDNGGTAEVTYNGRLTQARITADNAMEFSLFLVGDGPFELPPVEEVLAAPDSGATVNRQGAALARFPVPVDASGDQTTLSGSLPGAVSGLASYTATFAEDLSAIIAFTYVNFNNGDGYTFGGEMSVRVFDFDLASESYLSMEMSISSLDIQGDGEHLTLTGSAAFSLTLPGQLAQIESITMNFDGRDENTGKTFRLENLRSVMNCDVSTLPPESCTEDMSGRIYLEDEGYIEISLDSPLVYNYANRFNVEVPDGGGPMYLNGSGNTREVIRPLSIARVEVGFDTDGDGAYEETNSYSWYELAGLVITFEVLQGTPNFDLANTGLETPDGGYLAAGWTNTGGPDQLDGYLVKVDAVGHLEWAAGYGGAGDQELRSMVRTRDGGYALIGSSIGTEIPPVERIYVLKVNGDGIEQWSRTWIGELGDISSRGYAIHENSDGSLMVAGNMYSWGPFSGQVGLGFEDIYLAKLTANGELLWEKRLGGADNDYAHSLLQTASGGYLLAGTSSSLDYANLREELYLVKTDAAGNLLWDAHFGGAGNDVMAWSQYGGDVVEDAAGNLTVAGSTSTYSFGNVLYMVKVDPTGGLIWEKAFAGAESLPPLNSMVLATDGSYVLTGNGSFDVHLVQIDADGVLAWDKTFNWSPYLVMSAANAVRATSDGGYVVFGSAWPTQGKDFYIVKTNAAGDLW